MVQLLPFGKLNVGFSRVGTGQLPPLRENTFGVEEGVRVAIAALSPVTVAPVLLVNVIVSVEPFGLLTATLPKARAVGATVAVPPVMEPAPSTAPASTGFKSVFGLGLPKKSVVGAAAKDIVEFKAEM